MPTPSLNPVDAWTSAGIAATTAALEVTASATAMAMALCAGAMALPRREEAASSASPPPIAPAVLRGPRADGSGGRSLEGRPIGRSWYRAPYRSPFDPLFWMTPGHPVDHVGEWLGLVMAAAAPHLGGMPPRSPIMGDPVSAWLELMTMAVRAGPSIAAAHSGGNVIDFGVAYAAYRTSGGHAAAQVVRAGRREPSPERTSPMPLPFLWPWLPLPQR